MEEQKLELGIKLIDSTELLIENIDANFNFALVIKDPQFLTDFLENINTKWSKIQLKVKALELILPMYHELDNERMQQFWKCLLRLTQVESLFIDLWASQILTFDGFKGMAESIKYLKQLSNFSFYKCFNIMKDDFIAELTATVSNLPNLQKFGFYHENELGFNGYGISKLLAQLAQLPLLHTLELDFNHIHKIMIWQLQEQMMPFLKAEPNFNVILKDQMRIPVQFSKEEVNIFVEQFAKFKSLKNLIIDVSILVKPNDTSDIQVKSLLENVKKISTLENFTFNVIKQFSNPDLEALSKELSYFSHLKHLKLLFASTAMRYDDKSMINLAKALPKLINLEALTISFPFQGSVKCTETGMESFGQSLGQLKSIKTLNLIFNNTSNDGGYKLFTNNLLNLSQLEELRIVMHSDMCTNQSIIHLMTQLDKFNQLRCLALWFPGHGNDEGVYQLCQALKEYKKLQEFAIFLNGESLTDKSLVTLGETFIKFDQLTKLGFYFMGWKDFTKIGLKNLAEQYQKLKNLEYFYFAQDQTTEFEIWTSLEQLLQQ